MYAQGLLFAIRLMFINDDDVSLCYIRYSTLYIYLFLDLTTSLPALYVFIYII